MYRKARGRWIEWRVVREAIQKWYTTTLKTTGVSRITERIANASMITERITNASMITERIANASMITDRTATGPRHE